MGSVLRVKRHVRGITKRLQTCSRVYSRKRLIKNRHCGSRLRAVKDERGRDANRVLAGAKHQQAAMEAGVDDLIALSGGTFLRHAIPDQLDADHQPAAAHITDELVFIL